MEWNGEIIKGLAKERKVTLKDLAGHIGVSRQSLTDWINGALPKGNHLISLCKELDVTPNTFFSIPENNGITVPVHRAKANAKVTPERQRYAHELACEYSLFFRNISAPRIVPVIRSKDTSDESARNIAEKLRVRADARKGEPLNLQETFSLMENLGIHLIIKEFPDTIKAYAFYTNIHSYRVVYVDYNTNVGDLIFALLHEAIHAIRDEGGTDTSYDPAEEIFCDLVANYIQFPEDYIQFVFDSIRGLPKSHQINQLKTFGQKNFHALYGLVKQINRLHPEFALKVGGADTNFKKGFKTIGEALFSDSDVSSYLDTLSEISPVFFDEIVQQYSGLSDRRLGELLGVGHILDGKEVRLELEKRSKQRV
jgi:transcriptional regulator with XRE-family HTH domain